MSNRIRAVLFDLDDTLSDHISSVRAAVAAQQQHHAELASHELNDLIERSSDALEAAHSRMLAGEITSDQAREIRTRDFFAGLGIEKSDAELDAGHEVYREAYEAARGPVAGAHDLLAAIQAADYRLGLITNNLVSGQLAKLDRLEMRHYFEMLAISEEVGVPKPDPQIFHIALERMRLDVSEVVMVGDSLTSDIAGALGVGMACVWVDRKGVGADAAPAGVQATIAHDLADTDAAMQAIVGATST